MDNSVKEKEQRSELNKYTLLGTIIEFSNDIIISINLEGIITSWNPTAEKIYGYSEAEAIGQHISLIIPKENIEEEQYIIGEIKLGKKIDHFETVRISKTGKRIPISVSVSPIKDATGKITGASKIARDISENKNADERQAKLAAIVNNSDDAIISKTLKGIITSWNISAEKMFGHTEEEAVGKHISIIIPEERLKEEEYIINQITAGIKVDHFETIRKNKNGAYIPISITVSPIKDSNGTIIGASKIARDISSQKAAEANKKRYTKNLEIINSVSKIILQELDREKILQSVVDASTQLSHASFGAFFYNNVSESGESYMLFTVSGASRSDFEKFGMPSNTALFHPTFSGEGIFRSDDITKDERYGKNPPHYGMPKGHLPVVSYLAVPVIAKSGDVIGALFFGHPKAAMFTKEHEDAVASIATLAAIGLENAGLYNNIKLLNDKKDEFIGLASHELKTPLTSMMGYLQIINAEVDGKLQRFVTKGLAQGKKLSNLINDMLDVSKIEAGKLQFSKIVFDIRKVIDNSIEMMQQLNNDHKIELDTTVTGLNIEGDPERIEQVLLNLLTNAVKYSATATDIKVFLLNDSKGIRIGVQDNGMGISPEKLEIIFERFYRVDNANSIPGLGIGLYISNEIVKRHGGKILVESVPGKGSTFWVKLPYNKIN